jgi:glycosyltransferase involved in cell wall biosynthesis
MADAASIETFRPYFQYITGFLCPTKWVYNFYQINYGDYCKGNIIYLPIPIDTEYFKLNRILDKAVFLHNQGNGGAHYRKGSDLIYQVFKNLPLEYTIWINNQPELHQMYKLPKDLLNMTIHEVDFSEQIDAYRQGSIYIAPSKREGLGLPILEAMSCGLPVITTNAPPMNEWFSKDYPLLVEVGDIYKTPTGDIPYYVPKLDSLYDIVVWSYKNPEKMRELGTANRKIIEERYSWKVLKQQYLDILTGTL